MILFLRELVDNSKVIHEGRCSFTSNGLKIHLRALLLGSFRITFIDGQKHLKSLLLLHNIVCVCVEDMPCLNRTLKNIV